MQLWDLQISIGQFFIDFSVLGLLLYIATIVRAKVKWFEVNLIPVNLIAGIIGLVFVFGDLTYGFIESSRLGAYVYHLLALLFIAFGLRSPKPKTGLSSFKIGLIFIITYLVQAIVGLLLAMLLIYTFMPDLFAGIGLLLPLSFGMNPGIAFSIGYSWEAHGFADGGTVGLAFAAIGFLVAYSVGMIMVKRGIMAGNASLVPSENHDNLSAILEHPQSSGSGKLTTSSDAIESLSLHWSLIGLTYFLTYLVLKGTSLLMIGNGLAHEVSTLWSFHFVFAAIVSLFVRKMIDYFDQGHWIDDTTMTRTGNLFMDFMVVASISAITLAVVTAYWLPLLIIGTVTAIATWYVVSKSSENMFENYQLERKLAIFGNMTGTMQSALVLLRVLDPHHKSTVSQELVYGSGIALVLGFPLLLLINAPVHYFSDVQIGFWFVGFALSIYLLLLLGIQKFLFKK